METIIIVIGLFLLVSFFVLSIKIIYDDWKINIEKGINQAVISLAKQFGSSPEEAETVDDSKISYIPPLTRHI